MLLPAAGAKGSLQFPHQLQTTHQKARYLQVSPCRQLLSTLGKRVQESLIGKVRQRGLKVEMKREIMEGHGIEAPRKAELKHSWAIVSSSEGQRKVVHLSYRWYRK